MLETLSNKLLTINAKMPEFVKTICAAGWTIPPEMPIGGINFFNGSINDVDRVFLQFFECGNRQYLLKMFKNIEACDLPIALKRVFIECEKAYDQELYNICTISLMAIIEGTIVTFYQGEAKKRIKAICKEQFDYYNQESQDSIWKYAWQTYDYYIAEMFKYADFDAPEPRLNRNWLLHGESQYEFGKLECLKLFNGVSTICMIKKYDRKNHE